MPLFYNIIVFSFLFLLTSCLELLDYTQDPKDVFMSPAKEESKQKEHSSQNIKVMPAERIPIGNFTTKFRVEFPDKKKVTKKPAPKKVVHLEKKQELVKKIKPAETLQEEPAVVAVVKKDDEEFVEEIRSEIKEPVLVETPIKEQVIKEPKPMPIPKPEEEISDEELKALESMLNKKPEVLAKSENPPEVKEEPVEKTQPITPDQEVEAFKYEEMKKREVASVEEKNPEPSPAQPIKESPAPVAAPAQEEKFGCNITAHPAEINFGEESDLRLEIFGKADSYQVINPAEEGGPKEFRDVEKQRFYYVGMVTKGDVTEWCSTQVIVHFNKRKPAAEQLIKNRDWFEVQKNDLHILGQEKDIAIQVDETKDILTITLFELKKGSDLEMGKEIEKKMYAKDYIKKIKIQKKNNFSRVLITEDADTVDHTPVEFY